MEGNSSQPQETVNKGPWSPDEDDRLRRYVEENGPKNWRTVPAAAGLNRCGKSCRLRWANYLNPDVKRGNFRPMRNKPSSTSKMNGETSNHTNSLA